MIKPTTTTVTIPIIKTKRYQNLKTPMINIDHKEKSCEETKKEKDRTKK